MTLVSRLSQYTALRHSLHESIIDTIGKTPIVKLQRMLAGQGCGANVYVKLESENPGGSLKDRLAYGTIEWAEKHGHLQPGQVGTLLAIVVVQHDKMEDTVVLQLCFGCC